MHLTDMLRPDSLPSKGEAAKTLAERDGDASSQEASSGTPKFDDVVAQTATQSKSARDTPVTVADPDAQTAKNNGAKLGANHLNHPSVTQAGHSETLTAPATDLDGQAARAASDSKNASAALGVDVAGGKQQRESDLRVVPTDVKSPSSPSSEQRPQTVPSETGRQPAPRSEAPLTVNRTGGLGSADTGGPANQQRGAEQTGSRNSSTPAPKDDLTTLPRPEAVVQNVKPGAPSQSSAGEPPRHNEAQSRPNPAGASMLPADEAVTTRPADASKAAQNTQTMVLSAPQTRLGPQRGLARSDAKLDAQFASREGHIEVQLPGGNSATRAIPELNGVLSKMQNPANRPAANESRSRTINQAVAASATTESFATQSQSQSSFVTRVDSSLLTAPGLPPTGNEIARQIVAATNARRDGGVVEVLLDPPELGRIEIMIELGEQGLRATLTAERHSTADLIRRHMDLLGEQFSDAGFDLENLNLADERTAGNEGGDVPLVESASDQTPTEGSSRSANQGNSVGTDRIDIRL